MSDRTPTPKQVRNAYRRIMYAKRMLMKAYWNAFHLGMITKNGIDGSPIKRLYEFENEVVVATQDALATAMRTEISNALR